MAHQHTLDGAMPNYSTHDFPRFTTPRTIPACIFHHHAPLGNKMRGIRNVNARAN